MRLQLDLFTDECEGCEVSMSLIKDAEKYQAKVYALCKKEHRYIYLPARCKDKIIERIER